MLDTLLGSCLFELALLSTVMMIVFFSFNKFRTARRACSTFEIYDSTGLLADGDTPCNEDNHIFKVKTMRISFLVLLSMTFSFRGRKEEM